MSGRETSTLRLAITEPTELDPYRAQEMEGMAITKALYEGLLVLDRRHRVAPGAAQSWEGSADGRRWTFRLRPDGRFSTGEAVTAGSFVRAWNRATDPAAGSETTYHLSGVEGFADRVRGHADTLSGVRALDALTLQVTLAEPDHEFDKKTLQPIFYPVTLDAGPARDPAHNLRPVGNGPYAMRGPWQRGRSIGLTANPHYSGSRRPTVRQVEVRILEPDAALDREFDAFAAGELDLTRIPPGRRAEVDALVRAGCHEVTADVAGVMYLLPFTHQGVLADPRARRAVTHAIDRAEILQVALDGGARIASSLIPPIFTESHVASPDRVRHDPDLARRLAAEAGLVPGTELSLTSNLGAGHEEWVELVARQLHSTLGWRVRISTVTAAELVRYRTSEQATGCCRAGWMCDYPTPDNVLFPLLHSSCINPDDTGTAHGDNEGRYVDPGFDDLIRRARAAADPQERATLYRAAEERAIGEHMAIIPLWYLTSRRLVRPQLAGARIDAFGCVVFEDIVFATSVSDEMVVLDSRD